MLKLLSFCLLLSLLCACGEVAAPKDPNLDVYQQPQVQAGGLMVFAAVDDAYSTGSMGLVPLARPDAYTQGLHPTINTDFYVRCRANTLYRLESFNQDRVTLFDRLRPANVLAQVRTKPEHEPTSSVPIDLAFGPGDSALLVRYSRNKAFWMRASDQVFLSTGMLDMTTFADSDGYSEAKSALYWNGYWYVAHQRLNRLADGGWNAANDSKLSVINASTPDPMQSFKLSVRNPVAKMISMNGRLLVAGAGDLQRRDGTYAGIEVITRDAGGVHASERVLLPGRQIVDVDILDGLSNTLLAVEYEDFGKTRLHAVDIRDGSSQTLQNELANFEQLIDGHISAIERSASGEIWLSVFGGSKRGLWRFSANGRQQAYLPTKQNPVDLSFCQ